MASESRDTKILSFKGGYWKFHAASILSIQSSERNCCSALSGEKKPLQQPGHTTLYTCGYSPLNSMKSANGGARNRWGCFLPLDGRNGQRVRPFDEGTIAWQTIITFLSSPCSVYTPSHNIFTGPQCSIDLRSRLMSLESNSRTSTSAMDCPTFYRCALHP